MIRPTRETEFVVGPDGTLKMTGLKPGQRVRVVIEDEDAPPPEWVPGDIPGTLIYRPDLPRKEWGSLAEPGFDIDDPSEPACDPDDWDANR